MRIQRYGSKSADISTARHQVQVDPEHLEDTDSIDSTALGLSSIGIRRLSRRAIAILDASSFSSGNIGSCENERIPLGEVSSGIKILRPSCCPTFPDTKLVAIDSTPELDSNDESSNYVRDPRSKRARSRIAAGVSSTILLCPKVNLQSQHDHWLRGRNNLVEFFTESLVEVDHFPARPLLKKPKSHQNKSTHVSAFASMMTCASFWDEFVSMDQETTIPELEPLGPQGSNMHYNQKVDCVGGVQLDPYFSQLPRRLEDAMAMAAESNSAIVITRNGPPYLIDYVNSAWEALCGYTNEEVVGCTLSCIQGNNTRSTTLSKISRHLDAKVDCSARLTNYKKNGESFENLIRIVALKNDMGFTTHFLGVLEECI